MMDTEYRKILALLHDVVEDSAATFLVEDDELEEYGTVYCLMSLNGQ